MNIAENQDKLFFIGACHIIIFESNFQQSLTFMIITKIEKSKKGNILIYADNNYFLWTFAN